MGRSHESLMWLLAAVAGCGGEAITVLELVEQPGEGGAGCWAPDTCGRGQVCHPDGACRAAPAFCGQQACVTGGSQTCACAWGCSDESEYETRCRFTDTGLVTCNCAIDGVEFPWTCVVEEPTLDTCGMGQVCCAFPSSR